MTATGNQHIQRKTSSRDLKDFRPRDAVVARRSDLIRRADDNQTGSDSIRAVNRRTLSGTHIANPAPADFVKCPRSTGDTVPCPQTAVSGEFGMKEAGGVRRRRSSRSLRHRRSADPCLPALSEQNLANHDLVQGQPVDRRRRQSLISAASTGCSSLLSHSTLQRRLSLTSARMRGMSVPPEDALSASLTNADWTRGSRGRLINTSIGSVMVKIDGPDKVPPIQVFRRVARLVRLLCSVCIALRSYAIGKGLLDDYLVSISHKRSRGEDEEGDVEELTFNLKDFKIKKELEVPAAVVELLEKRPEDRTMKDITTIGRLMRGLPSFRKYTREMQQLFCKIVRYMKCQQNRVVLRKGHIGYNLYFIYTGACSVVLNKDDSNVFVKKEVIVLRKGACFGEIALVQNTRRNATVVCTEDTEFLVVDKDLFLDNGLHHQMEQEFRFRFNVFRGLPMMRHWTQTQVHELSNVSRTEEFGYNKVIVSDSRCNDWLWFVIKGSCDIIRLVDLDRCATFQQMVLGTGPIARLSLQDLAAAARGALVKPLSAGRASGSAWSVLSTDTETSEAPSTHRHKRDTPKGAEDDEHSASPRPLADIAEIDDVINALKAGDQVEDVLKVMTSAKTDAKGNTQNESNGRSDSSEEPGYGLFFKVDTLRDGQCFGMDRPAVDQSQSSRKFVLISRGCEVIHVPKTRFKLIADDKTLGNFAKTCKSYPSDDELCARFIARCKWDAYKQHVVQDVLDHRTSGAGFAENLRAHRGTLPAEGATTTQDAVASSGELRDALGGRSAVTVSQEAGAGRPLLRPHTSHGLRSQGQESKQKTTRKSWEMDLDLMNATRRSRDTPRDRPRTCPPGVSRRQALLGVHTRGHGQTPRTPRSSKSGRGKSVVTPRGYQVDATNVCVKGSQRTLQIVSNVRSMSREERLRNLNTK